MKECCLICSHETISAINAFDVATKHTFTYYNCSNCKVLYLSEIPANYAQYYGINYYSFNASNGIVQQLKHKRDVAVFSGKGIVGKFLALLQPNHNLFALQKLQLKQNESLLDVGCGVGNEIRVLKMLGYNKVFGVDPYINEAVYVNNDLLVQKQEVFDVHTLFKFITMHHSFEHVLQPVEVLKKLHSLLENNGKIMIRIPVAASYAFEKYGNNWVQFDAPRHTFLHTEKSMQIMCNQVGLNIDEVIYDSTSFQFWGSDIVQKGIGIHTASKATILKARIQSFFKGYASITKQLNVQNKGDQATFILSKK
jgi:2-polyprenyl-3-methyl-5-hydroxy-6-metoxy-1,4-benzoquinol methylase